LSGEERVIVDLTLDPGHEVFDVLGGGDLQRLLDALAVRSQVAVPGKNSTSARQHHRAALRTAVFHLGPVQQRDLVVELDRVHR